MKLVTREILAADAADRWSAQKVRVGSILRISYDRQEAVSISKKNKEVLEKLRALGDNPDPDDVDKVLGSSSWTRVGLCDECGKEVKELVQIGQEQDCDICKPCLLVAYNL
ncbi:MAG: hypothetical protein GY821_12875 [Gammaproteobacteria bacterium]|nr:hypothetical protein [Gammaproteobacteria bacterium]